MTRRALLIGLCGAAFMCAVTYVNDAVIRQTFLVGNHLPIAVYGALVAFVLCVNPLLRRTKLVRALSGSELAVALAITLAACAIPGGGHPRAFR